MKPLEVWTCQRAENLKKSSKIPKNNYAAKMVSAARRQIIGGGGGGAPINKSRRRRRSQIVGGGGAARPAHSSIRIIKIVPRDATFSVLLTLILCTLILGLLRLQPQLFRRLNFNKSAQIIASWRSVIDKKASTNISYQNVLKMQVIGNAIRKVGHDDIRAKK